MVISGGGMMKSVLFIPVLMALLVIGATKADAYVNDILTFTNYTDEELYVDLSISFDIGWHIYSLYVLPNHTSIADFWANSFRATYLACAYGEISGDFYGCIEGSISDYYNNVYFENGTEPYTSSPSDRPVEWYVFDNPYDSDDDDSYIYVRADCFINSIFGVVVK